MDGFEALDKIIPLIVFAIWIGSAIMGQGKKKRRPPTPVSPPAGSKSGESPEKKTSIFDELRRSLKTALEEMEPTTPVTPESSAPAPQGSFTYDEYQRDDLSLESRLDEENLESSLNEPDRQMVSTDGSHRIEKLRQLSEMQAVTRSEISEPAVSISRENLREGIVWSEILAPPIALRQ